jgi:hypothetical protein
MYTRSQRQSIKRGLPVARVIEFSKDATRWTQAEEREMIRLRRYENMRLEEIAQELHRTPEAVRCRFVKLFMEHATGDIPEKEVLRWFNLVDE